MPIFTVIIQGTGVSVAGHDANLTGFFTTQRVRASNELEAARLAKQRVLAEWIEGGTYYDVNAGELPHLRIDEIFEVGIIYCLFHRVSSKGCAFYSDTT